MDRLENLGKEDISRHEALCWECWSWDISFTLYLEFCGNTLQHTQNLGPLVLSTTFPNFSSSDDWNICHKQLGWKAKIFFSRI